MTDLKDALKGHTLAVLTAEGSMLVFDGRGVSDLHRLLSEEPQTLRGASVADKVVGRAAAALMMLGGVAEVYTEIVSDLALCLPGDFAVKVTYDVSVPHILNRAGTAWCPLESVCRNCETAEQCLIEINKFFHK